MPWAIRSSAEIRPALWIHGHIRDTRDYTIERTHILNDAQVQYLLASILFEVKQFDALTLGAIVAAQVVGPAGTFVPARRALK
jgi:hypothetical protein